VFIQLADRTSFTMSDHEDSKSEGLMEKITEKMHERDSSSSSSDDEDHSSSSLKSKVFRIFGREKPVHKVFGGGKAADIFLWRDKKISGAVLGGATAIWILFELMEFYFLSLISYAVILTLVGLFLWSNVSTFIHKSPPKIPEVVIPEKPVVQLAVELRAYINLALATLREIASGRELKKFLSVIAGLWFLSVLGSCCNFLTLCYIVLVLLFTVPVLYEKYDDKVDAFAEKAMIEIKKQYAVFDAKVLSKIPRGPLKSKKN